MIQENYLDQNNLSIFDQMAGYGLEVQGFDEVTIYMTQLEEAESMEDAEGHILYTGPDAWATILDNRKFGGKILMWEIKLVATCATMHALHYIRLGPFNFLVNKGDPKLLENIEFRLIDQDTATAGDFGVQE